MAALSGTYPFQTVMADGTGHKWETLSGARGMAHLGVGGVSKALGAGPQQRLWAQRAVLCKQQAGANPTLGDVQVLGRLHEGVM